MTSNIGVRQLKEFGDGVGFATSTKMQTAEESGKAVIEKALKRTFAPEFLNRIDDVIVFNSLNQEHIHRIIDLVMVDVTKRLAAIGFTIELSEKAKNFIAEKGYDQQFGARPLHRAIQKYLEDPLAENILNLTVKTGDVIFVDLDEANALLTFKHKSNGKKEKSGDAKA